MVQLTLITALSIAGVAAWYSIVGLMAIFAGAIVPIAIMGGVLEVGKLVTAAWLHQNWKKTSWWMKSYLTSAVLVLMVITSLGIFGFLSKAHLEHSISTGGTNELAIENLERRIAGEQRVITDAETVLSQLDASVQTLIDYDRIRGDSGAIAVRQSQAEERASLNETIDEAYANIEDLSGQLTFAKRKQLEIEVEVGPLKYIAELIYGDKAEGYFDEAVRAVILLLIVTFDPLAVVLLLAATQGYAQRKQEKMMMFNPDNVADMENNFEIVKVDPDDYVFIEDDIPPDDDIDDYDVVEPEPVIRSGKKRRVRKK
jgi:hypothetical protein